MLRKVTLKDWKSFEHAELHIDPFTIIIGANASGKSNSIDALVLLSRLAKGMDVVTALEGGANLSPLRGGALWAARVPKSKFTISAVIAVDAITDLEYTVTIDVSEKPIIVDEQIIRTRYRPNTKKSPWKKTITSISRDLRGWIHWNNAEMSILGIMKGSHYRNKYPKTLSNLSPFDELITGISIVSIQFQRVLLLEPVPSRMRDFSFRSSSLNEDGSNIAGVFEAIPERRKRALLKRITSLAKNLPEHEIVEVTSELVGRMKKDAMLYCTEMWGKEKVTVDARGMSDGTLRFLAILAALLTRPKYSCLIIEEIDSGLHPSRARDLIILIEKIREERDIDVVITTHNPALLNELIPKYIPFVTVAHRDRISGGSKLVLLESIPNLTRLLSRGKLGDISMDGSLQNALNRMEE